MSMELREGARIVVRDWLRLKPGESLAILSDELHVAEAMELRSRAAEALANPVVVIFSSELPQSGEAFDARCAAYTNCDAIIGAMDSSIMTARSIREAVARGSRFLSLPLSTNSGASLLESDFLAMDSGEAEARGLAMAASFRGAREATIRTRLGTNLRLSLEGRRGSVFAGRCDARGISSSASFEFSIAPREDSAEGELILDGSLGYLGLVSEHVGLRYRGGRLVEIEQNPSGRRLSEYLEGFSDERMYVAAELGIGTNTRASCAGRSYIEDECAYGTFHIGMGRNIALGGRHYANGHFDLVCLEPDIFADGKEVMRNGMLLP